ncbi:MAG TPA: sigma 54-interacting transcriptional regulator [Patescibacteria group bacterium]|nr:sigma 54-interacting transcriptional regulator [Patescibacteria group bacterium]
MQVTRTAVIRHGKGLHARVIAMIVQKAHELQERHRTALFLSCRRREHVPATNLMALVALSIRQGEQVQVSADGAAALEAVEEMVRFLESDFSMEDDTIISQLDKVIHDSAITAEQVFSSMANGLVVTDRNDMITVFNPAAERITGVPAAKALGQPAMNILPGSRLHIVTREQMPELGRHQVLGNSVIITNRTPIVADGEVQGAVAIFEDISSLEKITGELKEIKELKERLQLVLESVQDGICVADSHGIITYVNPAYLRIVEQSREELIGRNIGELSPAGARNRALASGQPVLGHISRKGDNVTIVANVNPIIVDGEVAGVVSVVKNVTELHSLMHKLNQTAAKAEYFEQELLRTKKPDKAFETFIGRSGKVRDALAVAAKAAAVTATVLIRGESGTGKELVAEGIHFASRCSAGPFIRVNCAAIPPNLLESELFGHEKGAFTGALRRKPGKFELAHKGTIFLDEIGEMPKDMQVKLLRVLQQKEFSRVGGEDQIKVDVRIIAATNRNLEDMVEQGEFREDLYYRLNVISLLLPPLRERREDIPLLLEHFLGKTCREAGREISGFAREAMEALMQYNWPGNVRELENMVERLVALTDRPQLEWEELPAYLRTASPLTAADSPVVTLPDEGEDVLKWEEYEKRIIQKALKRYGSFNAAGKALGLTHKTIGAKAQKYGLSKTIVWQTPEV